MLRICSFIFYPFPYFQGIKLIKKAVSFVYFPKMFAKWYTLGSLLLLSSTFFLMGPLKQIQTMFQRERAPATIVYIVSIIGTLYAALVVTFFISTM